MFSGSIPALVTPFRGGSFDESAYRSLIDWQIESGSAALVACGTTGEVSTLTHDEQYHIIRVCIEHTAGRVPVIAGCGSNDTRTSLAHMAFAESASADAALVVAPYYNRPSQAGIVAHFEALTEANDLPIIVYNVPSRTVTDIMPETMARLAAMPSVVGVKDASGQIERVTDHRLGCGPDFVQLAGNDAQALAFNAAGGVGCISVTANVAPRLCAEFQSACADEDFERARLLNDRLFPLHCALFADASPGPTKYALNRLRPDMPDELRLPIVPCSIEARRAVDAALEKAGLT